MSSNVQQRALDILEASLDLSVADQARFIEEAAGSDAELAAELRRLEPARAGTSRLLATGGGVAVPGQEREAPGRIGAFRIGRLLGRGGMGSVFEGERDDGLFQQRVAIKLLNARHWSREFEQSLDSERRILARLEHRNIARIYDGGVTPDGLSYIVMERIDGVPIDEYADQHGLGLEARIRLFGQLTAALQFAHQQFVVHADIKPSNVLVSADGSVKLLDFGIAALIDRDSPQQSGRSPGSAPMTRAYAAPERRRGAPASVAGDVYSAGILLRNLLSDSTHVGRLPIDLAAVIRKATAEPLDVRHGSVAELREDLTAWLERLPVPAYEGGWRYRVDRFVARNRLTAIVATLLFSGLSVATFIAFRLYLEARRATAAEAVRFEEAREINSFLVNDLSGQMLNRPGTVEANWQTLSVTLGRLEQLAASKPQDIPLQLDLARNVVRIAEASVGGYSPSSVDSARLREKLAATERRLGALESAAARSGEYWAVRAEIDALQSLAATRLDGDTDAARRSADAAIASADLAQRFAPRSVDAHTAWLRAQMIRAASLNAAGEQAAAISELDLILAGEAPIDDATLAGWRRERALLELKALRCDVKRWLLVDAESLRDCTAFEQELRRSIEKRGHLIYLEATLAYTLFRIASQLGLEGSHERALRMLDEAQQIYARILYFGENSEAEGDSLVVESARAASLAALGRVTEARASAANLLVARRARLAAQPQATGRRREVATALRRVGEVELAVPDSAAACSAFREAETIWEQLEREGRLLAFDLAPRSGQVPWLRIQLERCR